MRETIKDSNNGFSLILVLISTFLILTLGLTLISVSAMNLRMKTVDKKSKSNFYSAESAIDEINTGLEEIVTEEIKKAYTQFLKDYSNIYPSDRQEEFRRLANDYVYEALVPYGTTTSEIPDRMKKMFKDFLEHTVLYDNTSKKGVLINSTGDSSEDESVIPQLSITKEVTEKTITIHDLYVEYRDEDYKSIIQTDIVISSPSDVVSGTFNSDDLGDYAIIADQQLSFGDEYISTRSKIEGNVYAGENGIDVSNQNSYAMIEAQNLITSGDITVKTNASLTIDGPNPGINEIWAQNIKTEKTNSTPSSDTFLHINGNCFVNNDLQLNAQNSKVIIKGKYNGYMTKNNPSAINGSAIIVNAKNSTLDLGDVTDLTVAGNAYIQVPDIGGFVHDPIMMGDSIALKSNQIAYLVPNEYISVGHNPILESELIAGASVDLTSYSDPNITLTDYVDMTNNGYHEIHYIDSMGEKIIYYYLDFKNEQFANDYIVKYSQFYNETLKDIKVTFPYKDIKVGMNYHTNGSVTSYDEATDIFKILSRTSDSALLNTNQIDRQTEFDCLKKILKKTDDGSLYNTELSAGKNYINFTMIEGKPQGINLYTNTSPYNIQIINNTGSTAYRLGSVSTGLIIASGDVEIDNNFSGLVIAGGKVTLINNAMVSANPSVVNQILNKNDPTINVYFNNIAIPGGSPVPVPESDDTTIDISNLLTYQNWRKK